MKGSCSRPRPGGRRDVQSLRNWGRVDRAQVDRKSRAQSECPTKLLERAASRSAPLARAVPNRKGCSPSDCHRRQSSKPADDFESCPAVFEPCAEFVSGIETPTGVDVIAITPGGKWANRDVVNERGADSREDPC